MTKKAGLLLCLLVMCCAEVALAANTLRRYVLVVGANNGGEGRLPLRYAVSDAENFVQVLEIMGGVDPADRILLREPDLQTFRTALNDIRTKVQSEPDRVGRTEVIVYYSGHADETGLLLGEERFSYRNLRDQMDAIQADVHITVLDACASGAITRLKGGQHKKAFQVDESSDMRGYAFLTSSSEDETAQESDGIEASFFTHYLVSGMRGAADVSGDGKVTLGEAYQFAFHETLARTVETQAGAQHPAYDIKLVGSGDVVMTDIRQTSAGLILSENLGGHFYIRDADQHLVAEVYKAVGRRMELGLEPGEYSIQYKQDPGLFQSSLVLINDERKVLDQANFQAMEQEQTALRGSPQATPTTSGSTDDHYRLSMGVIMDTQPDPFRGLQLSLVSNSAEAMTGTQIAFGANIGQENVTGFQLALGFNYAKGDVGYGQYSQIFNWSDAKVSGAQMTTVFNVAEDIIGFQGSSVVNVAKRATGVQLSLINVANYMKGVQLGLINVSDDIDGLPIGLFNYSRTGIFDTSIWTDETGLSHLTLMSGTRNYYMSYSVGYNPVDNAQPFAVGLGIGGHYNMGRQYFGIDATAHMIKDQFKENSPENLLARLRLMAGIRVNKRLSFFAGPSFNVLVTDGDPALINPLGSYESKAGDDNFVWPGFFAGIRIGRFGL